MHIQSQNPVSVEDTGVFFVEGGRNSLPTAAQLQAARDWWELGERAERAVRFEARYALSAIELRVAGYDA